MNGGWLLLAAIRRLKIRRLYNKGIYEKSRTLSMRELSNPTNREFAIDIVLRSNYNQRKWQDLVDFADSYSVSPSHKLVEKARGKMYAISNSSIDLPIACKHEPWKPENPLANWYQETSRLWFRYPAGWVFWDMPIDFDLDKTHPSLLLLAMNILLKPYEIQYPMDQCSKRFVGTHIGLSYSGGIDSTAAAILLPNNTILAYHERSFPSSLNHGLAKRAFEKFERDLDKEILCISSNHEIIRSSVDLPVGFSSDFAAGVHLVLLSDYLDLNTIAFGTPIDNTWLKKGATFRDFSCSPYWLRWKKSFNHAGLNLEFPINHISEAGAMKICSKAGFIDHINSCLRGDGVSGCEKCWKCFNKNGPLGRKIQFDSDEIQTFLHRTPMPTAMHALWSLQVQRLENKAPQWHHQLTKPLDWWEMYYPPGLSLITHPLRIHIEEKTREFLMPMEKPYPIEQVNIYPEPVS